MSVLYLSPVSICFTMGNKGLFDPPRAYSESRRDPVVADSWAIRFTIPESSINKGLEMLR